MNNKKSMLNFSAMKKKRSAMREKANELGFKNIHSAVIAGHGEALAKAYVDQSKARSGRV
ncbi:MAG: hypothetical protein IM631_12615 [Cytophagales bacterium]|jgi:hypothetical protein|nr:hypothetical protein [Cytophagales bacterium]MCA6382358.1 hypothetical protein [Cytophagales bacterium]